MSLFRLAARLQLADLIAFMNDKRRPMTVCLATNPEFVRYHCDHLTVICSRFHCSSSQGNLLTQGKVPKILAQAVLRSLARAKGAQAHRQGQLSYQPSSPASLLTSYFLWLV